MEDGSGPVKEGELDRDRMRARHKFNVVEGFVVFLRPKMPKFFDNDIITQTYETTTCDVPLAIVSKSVKELTDPDLPRNKHNIKHVRLKPVGPALGDDKVRLALCKEADFSKEYPYYDCIPFEKEFSELWTQYGEREPEHRRALIHGLKQQKDFYPELSYAEFFTKLRVDSGVPNAKEEAVPPELLQEVEVPLPA